MASKLRRAPLFGIDSGFSIVPPQCKVKGKGVPFQMECEVTSSGPANYGGGRSPNGTTTPTSTSNKSTTSSSGGGGKSQLHVDFIEHGEVKEKREKYLTAKYGSHQMSLIRKRLSVEMWLYDELQKLYEEEEGSSSSSSTSSTNHEVEIDLDEVLDMDGDNERRSFLLGILTDAKKPRDVVDKFIDEVIAKAKTL